MITLVLGGARSGKSDVGERITASLPSPHTYVATAEVEPSDHDHVARIVTHRARRDPSWTTIELGGRDLPSVLCEIDGSVLVDSLGTWVAGAKDFSVDADALRHALVTRAGDTVVVSEEVGLGVHPSSEAGRRFRDALGTLNTAIADAADDVLLVVAGRVLPLDRR